MGAMKSLAEELILEAEERGIKIENLIEDLIKDFAENYGVDATDLSLTVKDLIAEDEKKCEKIDKLLE